MDDCEPKWDGQLGVLLIGGSGTHKSGHPNPNMSDVVISNNTFQLQGSTANTILIAISGANGVVIAADNDWGVGCVGADHVELRRCVNCTVQNPAEALPR